MVRRPCVFPFFRVFFAVTLCVDAVNVHIPATISTRCATHRGHRDKNLILHRLPLRAGVIPRIVSFASWFKKMGVPLFSLFWTKVVPLTFLDWRVWRQSALRGPGLQGFHGKKVFQPVKVKAKGMRAAKGTDRHTQTFLFLGHHNRCSHARFTGEGANEQC